MSDWSKQQAEYWENKYNESRSEQQGCLPLIILYALVLLFLAAKYL